MELSLVGQLRRKGYTVRLRSPGWVVEVGGKVPPDAAAAMSWLIRNEQQLRRELVAEFQKKCLGHVMSVFNGAKIREVTGPGGERIVGAVEIVPANDAEPRQETLSLPGVPGARAGDENA